MTYVWIFRPPLVCFAVASGTIWSWSAILELFLTFGGLVVSLELGVLSRKCKGTREYVRKPAPVSAGNGRDSRMRRYIRGELFRQIYSISIML